MKHNLLGYTEALQHTLSRIAPLESRIVSLAECTNQVVAEDLRARVNSPSVDASLKDGYAVLSQDIQSATPSHPVRLEITGLAAAGNQTDQRVEPGTAIRILTGAKIPGGADAVVAEEFTTCENNFITVTNHAEPGRNILREGSDVSLGELMISAGSRLVPGMAGILAAAGYGHIPVVKPPRVAIIATGDEVVAPGRPLPEGKLFASNLVTLNAWCQRYSMQTSMDIVGDDTEIISERLSHAIDTHDAMLTSGGAWTGDRDFVAGILNNLGWQQIFHRIRIGPGKAVGFGLLRGKPVFILPGGPPSNLLAFLQIALPGLLKLAGHKTPELPKMSVKLAQPVTGRNIDWTQFIFGNFREQDDRTFFYPLKLVSRLQSMARAEGIIAIPEGVIRIEAGTTIPAQLLV